MTNNQANENLSAAIPQQNVINESLINNDGKGITAGVGTVASSVFDINKIVSAIQNYNALNSVVNELIGYNFKWFRSVPQQRSKDVIFQEYTLSNVEECPLDIKAVVPQGSIPDSKYTYDLMGLEYEVPFEIQIDKKYWESVAGFGTAPQKKDIVYFPLSNKLYQVESSYLFRGFMEQETTWKINLKKYAPEASRRERDALKETIDIYTVSSEEIFGAATDNEVNKIVNDTQFSQFNGTSEDKYKSFDSSLNTISSAISMYGTIIAESFYDMQTPNWYDAITYNTRDYISPTSDRSITTWISPRTISNVNKEFSVSDITEIVSTLDPSELYSYDASLYSSANYSITLSTPISISQLGIDNNIIISRPGALNFYGKVVAISINPLKYHIVINPFVLEDLVAIKSDWFNQKGYKLMIKEPISLLDGVNEFGQHVFSLNIYANQYIAISYGHTYSNDNAYVVKMNDKLNDNEWYGIVVNIGNSWKQYSVYVWKKHDTDKNAKLQNIFYETLKLYPEEIVVDHYSINKSPSYLTNLRLFNNTIEEEKQSNELLSYFSKDGNKLILSDSADQIMKLPYITKQK